MAVKIRGTYNEPVFLHGLQDIGNASGSWSTKRLGRFEIEMMKRLPFSVYYLSKGDAIFTEVWQKKEGSNT
jgi:hypothetical protein